MTKMSYFIFKYETSRPIGNITWGIGNTLFMVDMGDVQKVKRRSWHSRYRKREETWLIVFTRITYHIGQA